MNISPPRLAIATIATALPMGAENYQEQIAHRAVAALAARDSQRWIVEGIKVRSLRSTLPGNRRIPMAAIANASTRVRREVGRWLYPQGAVTHRMNLELPPSPHADVVTIHDVVAWRFADESAAVPAAPAEARGADAVVCVSAFTAQEAIDLLGIRNPHVVHNGVDDRFFDARPLEPQRMGRLGIDGPYILHTGGAARRKNLEALAEAWPMVRRERPQLKLVLAGPEHPRRTELFRGMEGAILLGRVADDLVPGLVAGAAVLVVPSLYEGFGLPVLEAMAANVPVVAANTSSLPEVAGDAAILVAPTGPGLVEGLLDATSSASAVDRLVQLGRARAQRFTWDASARAHAGIWQGVR